jgi:ABC-2 type transport system permease protein
MIVGALFYYQSHSIKNRLLTRVKRLRRPKYLVGAIVGVLYFYFYIFRTLIPGRHGPGMPAIPPQHQALAQSIAALMLLIMVLLAWVLPHSRAALAFTEAEIAFLFPAPIGRGTLINFKLLRSQFAILFSSLIMALVGRGWGSGSFIIRGLGWWVLLSAYNLHLLGSSFTLTMWMDHGLSNWKRRTIFLGAAGALATGVVVWARATLPPIVVPNFNFLGWLADYAAQVLQSGPLPYLLAPFRLVVTPYFTTNISQFIRALGPALAIIAVQYWWVVRSNVAFEEASVELSQRMAERVAAVRSGNLQVGQLPKKASRPPFMLRPVGNPLVAVFWKNLISAGRFVTARIWLVLFWLVLCGGVVMKTQAAGHTGVGTGMVFFSGMLLAMSLFSGPQMLRNDLRQDLPAMDVLKMWPLRGWQVVLGEVLAPAAILAGFQWLLLAVAAISSPQEFEKHSITLATRVSFALAAAVVLPFIDLTAMLIPNASVLFFPAWFQLGREGPRGFETTGQQLILMFGQLLTLTLSLLPPFGAFVVIFFLGSHLIGAPVAVVLASVAAAILLAAEAGVAIKLLGDVFERFDLSSEIL